MTTSDEAASGVAVRVEVTAGRLLAIAAGWKLRALSLESTGMSVAPACLRECAEELEAAVHGRDAKRTSWYAHEQAKSTHAPTLEITGQA